MVQNIDSSVGAFYSENLIVEVIGVVKSGKEATVYCCRAHPSTGHDLFAVKVYRSQQVRSFKNDAIYQLGRSFSGESKANDARMQRAAKNRSRVGKRILSESWVKKEFVTMGLLYRAGAHVPEPIKATDSALLLEWIGDSDGAAPQLQHAVLTKLEARNACDLILGDIYLALSHDIIHGDLSPFNVLYHNSRTTIIDFPQAIDPWVNPFAFSLLYRDVTNICDFFSKFGVVVDAGQFAFDLWDQFLRRSL